MLNKKLPTLLFPLCPPTVSLAAAFWRAMRSSWYLLVFVRTERTSSLFDSFDWSHSCERLSTFELQRRGSPAKFKTTWRNLCRSSPARKHVSKRAKSCWRQSSAACWPATAKPCLPSSFWTPSVWTRSWRSRRRWCWSTFLRLCFGTSSALPAGWWRMDATKVRLLGTCLKLFRFYNWKKTTFTWLCIFLGST